MKALIAFLILIGLPGPLLPAPSPKKTHERAWLGGEYKLAKNSLLFRSRDIVAAFPKSEPQRAGIFVSAIHSNTPAALGGLNAGDLILRIDDQPVASFQAFRKLVDSRSPGEAVRLSIYREGEILEQRVTLGREAYRRERALGLGLLLSSKVDLVPNPDFSLIAAGFKRRTQRLELQSPETRFLLQTHAGNGRVSSAPAREGWQAWLAIISFGSHKRILSQEVLPSSDKFQAVFRSSAATGGTISKLAGDGVTSLTLLRSDQRPGTSAPAIGIGPGDSD
jgi:membrane-associated protease RseP (regulator of RpoE activity)